MGGDYTRWTFKPAKDYAELFKQQGRVDLDADWNELVEIVDRRWRAETIDIIGRAVVPLSTPDAFQIVPAGPGRLTIGIGRMYVDGLLAECHGIRGSKYDAALGEVNGTAPVPFDRQPYYPQPNPRPSRPGATDLIYLDVWRREVTAVQDPSIRETALGGPDTATRIQTVWQVKVLPRVGRAHKCGDIVPGWAAIVAPSAGRLTTSTVVPPASPDPCVLSPTGGYRGLENRLYRVEVHVAGTVGGASPAKFKWSRDNASIVTAVDSISAPGGPFSVVTLKSLGKDRVLRFQAGDWVEIVDDYAEFAGTSGFLTKIVAPPDEANRTITVTPSIPAGLFDATDSQRHTRVRRWDERSTGAGSPVDPATGLIDVNAGPIEIEDGIQVAFSDDPSGGQLHVGDYWLFAARTADGSVELLTDAPPRGILHHYAPLGFFTSVLEGPGRFIDCRVFWPTSGSECDCCKVMVRPEDLTGNVTLQSILDQNAGAEPFTICLLPGIYNLPLPLVLAAQHANLTLRALGGKVTLQAAQGSEARFLDGLVVLQQTANVTLKGLSFALPIVPFQAAGGRLAGLDAAALLPFRGPQVQTLQNLGVSIGLRSLSSSGVTIGDCEFAFPSTGASGSRTAGNLFAAGVLASGVCNGFTLEKNRFKFPGGSWQSTQEPFEVVFGCAIVPATTVTDQSQDPAGGPPLLNGTIVMTRVQDVAFRRNDFQGLSAAALIFGETGSVVLEDNNAENCYSGFWLLARRTPAGQASLTSDQFQAIAQALVQDPILALGSAIARSYSLPSAYSDPSMQVSVSKVLLPLGKSPFPAGSLLADFDVLLQLLNAMESSAAANSRPVGLGLSLQSTNNRISAEAIDVNLGSSGGGLIIWGDDQVSSTDLILSANRLRSDNRQRRAVPTVTIVSVSLCTVTGNLILNAASRPPAGSLFLLLNPNPPSGMAVTGNILQGGDNLPNNWKALNMEL